MQSPNSDPLAEGDSSDATSSVHLCFDAEEVPSVRAINDLVEIRVSHLDHFYDCFTKINQVLQANGDLIYHFVRIYDKWPQNGGKPDKCFSMTCLSPAFLLKRIVDESPISVIITSGTLSPMQELDEDLGI
jgi:hypothetical protein